MAIGGRCELIVPSRTLERLARRVWRIPKRLTHLVSNGIELARFADAEPARLPFEGQVVVGSIGALRPEKNLGRLLQAFASLGNLPARLVIVGYGGERAKLEAEAQRLGLGDQVLFAGHADDTASFYKAFDLFALSSDTEQMPYSVIEAAAVGLPVIATDVGDVKHMLAPKFTEDCVAPKADAGAYAAMLRRMVENKMARTAVGSANQTYARAHFGIDRMLETYDRLFQARITGRATA